MARRSAWPLTLLVKADAGNAGAGDFHFENATDFERVIAVNRGETGRMSSEMRGETFLYRWVDSIRGKTLEITTQVRVGEQETDRS